MAQSETFDVVVVGSGWAGATIGPAMAFGYVAANDIAERSGNQRV